LFPPELAGVDLRFKLESERRRYRAGSALFRVAAAADFAYT
jgi:hypothetical protein